MKHTDYPEEDGRTVPFQPEPKEVSTRRDAGSTARDVDSGGKSAEPGATRNITLGITGLVLAAIGLWIGRYYAGAAVARTLVASLGAFGILMLLNGCRVLRQRNGMVLALGVVALFGTAIPFVEGGFRKLDQLARTSLGASPDMQPATPLSPPPAAPTAATAPPAPPAEDLPETGKPTLASGDSPKTSKPVIDDGPPRELILPPPPEDAGKLVRLKEDVKVPLDGRMTILRAGTIAPFKGLEDGKVTFLANGSEVSINSDLVVFTGATREKAADITALAEQEAKRRYPRIFERDSRENLLFVVRAKEIRQDKEMSSVFFSDPKWPLVLAEQIAEQEGWVRADLPAGDSAEKDVPANEAPADGAATDANSPDKAPELPDVPPDPAGPPVDPQALPNQKNPAPPSR